MDQKEIELFYLTPDGEDVSSCGKTVETACKTLHQILNIYYNTSGIPQHRLEIITSKQLITINKQLMVRRMSWFTFSSSSVLKFVLPGSLRMKQKIKGT